MKQGLLKKILTGSLFAAILCVSCNKDDDSLNSSDDKKTNTTAEIQCNCNDVCEPETTVGSFKEGEAFDQNSAVSFTVNVTKIGDYKLHTEVINGYSLKAEGSFSELGAQTLQLYAEGTPVAQQTDYFNINIGESNCSLAVDIASSKFLGLDNKIVIFSGLLGFPDELGLTFAMDGYGKSLWSETYLSESYAIEDDILYLITEEEKISALNILTGEAIWKNENHQYLQGLTLAEGVLYSNINNGIKAFDAETGNFLWEFSTESNNYINPIPVVNNNQIYLGDDKVYALNLDGTLSWEMTPPNSSSFIFSSLTFDGDMLYVSDEENLYAINTINKNVVWEYNTGRSYASTVSNGKIYARGNALYCLDSQTGELIWSNPLPVKNYSWPTVSEGVVYVTDRYTKAIDAETGTEMWSIAEGSDKICSPTVCENLLFYCEVGSGLRVVKKDDASYVWSYGRKDYNREYLTLQSSPVVYDTQTKEVYYPVVSGNKQ
ncbi:MAG: PQQ-binding-like beta-propeller repeat protein [Bacteroidota bacterium]